MGIGAGLYVCDVVKKFTFAISSPDEFLYFRDKVLSVRVGLHAKIAYVSVRCEIPSFIVEGRMPQYTQLSTHCLVRSLQRLV